MTKEFDSKVQLQLENDMNDEELGQYAQALAQALERQKAKKKQEVTTDPVTVEKKP